MQEEIVVIDRRAEKREQEAREEALAAQNPKPVGPTAIDAPVSDNKRTWKSLTYTIFVAPMMDQNTQQPIANIPVVKAIALRSDGFVCTADYALPQEMPEGYDWQKSVKERIETYRKCACKQGQACISHRTYIADWMKQDNNRLILSAEKQVSPAMEALHEVLQKRAQSRIVTA